jgi:hypothetical protein
MEVEELKKKREMAQEAVKDMQDESMKQKAFEVILNYLLQEKYEVKKSITVAPKTDLVSEKKEPSLALTPDSLATALNVEIDRLNEIIDFSPNEFHIIAPIPGGSHKERQQNATLLILTTNYYCTSEREMGAKVLAAMMRDLGIKSLANLALNLKNFENFIVKKGEQGDPRTNYRITDPGLRRGLDLIRELIENRNHS